MTLQAFALLCALATLSCVANAARASQLVYVAAGALAGSAALLPALLGLPFAPLVAVEPAQIALLLALFALARLRGQVGMRVALFAGGVLALIWLQALRGLGWPLLAALPFVLVVVAVACIAGLQRAFLPPRLQDDVALLMLVGGLLVGLVPQLGAGWSSAQAFQDGVSEATGVHDVVWVAAGFVACGAGFAFVKSKFRWKR